MLIVQSIENIAHFCKSQNHFFVTYYSAWQLLLIWLIDNMIYLSIFKLFIYSHYFFKSYKLKHTIKLPVLKFGENLDPFRLLK